jgi:hypothetical protein
MDYVVAQKATSEPKERSCGDCTKCCEGHLQMTIYGQEVKKDNPCRYLEVGKGCSIYEKRPKNPCKTYQCLWLKDPSIPDWVKPNLVNAIVDDYPMNGFPCIRVNEAGEKLPSDVLSWALEYAIINEKNIYWRIDGKAHWLGSSEFCAEMERIFPKS